jgi:hypothetical protein
MFSENGGKLDAGVPRAYYLEQQELSTFAPKWPFYGAKKKDNFLPKDVRRIRILIRESRCEKFKDRMVVPRAYYLEQHELSLAASCPAPCVSRVPPAVVRPCHIHEISSAQFYSQNFPKISFFKLSVHYCNISRHFRDNRCLKISEAS